MSDGEGEALTILMADDEQFLGLLADWVTDNAGGTVTTADFVARADAFLNAPDLDLFQDWLNDPGKPTGP